MLWYIEFCLFNTWVIMRVMMLITPKYAKHPCKRNPPPLRIWVVGASKLLIEVSIVLTTTFLMTILAIIRGITLEP